MDRLGRALRLARVRCSLIGCCVCCGLLLGGWRADAQPPVAPATNSGVPCTSPSYCIAVGEYDHDHCTNQGCTAATLPLAERVERNRLGPSLNAQIPRIRRVQRIARGLMRLATGVRRGG